MTILGYNATLNRAFIWADNLFFCPPELEPTRRGGKIFVNPLAASAVVTTGHHKTGCAAADALMSAATFDEASKSMPEALRAAFHESAKNRLTVAPASAWRTSSCLVGYSHTRHRIVGTVFSSEFEFEPTTSPMWMSPQVEGDADVCDEHSAIFTAQMQVARLRKLGYGDRGSVLTFAELTPTSVSVRILCDLTRGVGLKAPPESES